MSVHAHIESLQSRHAALETAIEEETRRPYPDSDKLRQLKLKKLRVKDELSAYGSPTRH